MSSADEIYTHGHDEVVVAAHAQRTAGEAAAFLLSRLEPGTRLIDFGCGPGSITVGLAEHLGPDGSVVGIDNSPEAVELALRASHEIDNITVESASVYQLPFADGSFDAAYGHQVLQHLADPVTALREIHRVLRPGGVIGVRDADYGSMTHHPPSESLASWLRLYQTVARANGGEPDAGRRLPEWVQAAGFTDLEVTSSVWTFATEPERRSWAQLWASRIMLPRFADRAVDLGICDRSEIGAIASGWHRWATESNGWFAFIHGEVVAVKPPV
jgi:ubiquinone/menaquinone biosynthesis C-methylase UbiE